MKYYVPDIELASVLPPQRRHEDKLGGAPGGLPAERWPLCAHCGQPQTMLAQLRHEAARLDLMGDGRVLFVFHCANNPGLCDDWDQNSGGNVAFVLQPHELLKLASPMPAAAPPSYPEVRVVGWFERDDGLDDGLRDSFFSERAYLHLSDQDVARVTMSTRLGGVPAWIQSRTRAQAKDGDS